MSTRERMEAIVREHLGLGDKVISMHDAFDTMGADSLDQVELCMSAETEFDIEIPDADAEKLTTIAKVVEYVEAKKAE